MGAGGRRAGMSKGSKMLIANTKIFDDFINKIPSGDFVEIKEIRSTLAKQFNCDVTCPPYHRNFY